MEFSTRRTRWLDPALLMGAIAGARQNTSSMQSAQEQTKSAVPFFALRMSRNESCKLSFPSTRNALSSTEI